MGLTLIKHKTMEMQAFGKARPRVTSRGTFMPRDYMAKRDELILRFGGKIDTENPLCLHVVVTRKMPKSWTKAKKKSLHNTPCLTKPDIDNIVGAVMDALLDEDSHVFRIEAQKFWATEDSISVYVYEGLS